MVGKHTQAQANRQGDLTVSHTTTDAPLLPIEQLVKLKAIAPDKLEWVFEQTELESNHRRSESRRVNSLVFIERILSLIFALVIVLVAFGGAAYLAMNGHDSVAMVVAGGGLAYVVSAFLGHLKDKKQ